jgi:hypothetical protein
MLCDHEFHGLLLGECLSSARLDGSCVEYGVRHWIVVPFDGGDVFILRWVVLLFSRVCEGHEKGEERLVWIPLSGGNTIYYRSVSFDAGSDHDTWLMVGQTGSFR